MVAKMNNFFLEKRAAYIHIRLSKNSVGGGLVRSPANLETMHKYKDHMRHISDYVINKCRRPIKLFIHKQ